MTVIAMHTSGIWPELKINLDKLPRPNVKATSPKVLFLNQIWDAICDFFTDEHRADAKQHLATFMFAESSEMDARIKAYVNLLQLTVLNRSCIDYKEKNQKAFKVSFDEARNEFTLAIEPDEIDSTENSGVRERLRLTIDHTTFMRLDVETAGQIVRACNDELTSGRDDKEVLANCVKRLNNQQTYHRFQVIRACQFLLNSQLAFEDAKPAVYKIVLDVFLKHEPYFSSQQVIDACQYLLSAENDYSEENYGENKFKCACVAMKLKYPNREIEAKAKQLACDLLTANENDEDKVSTMPRDVRKLYEAHIRKKEYVAPKPDLDD